MECGNQAAASVHMLKSGETVFLYYDHSTGEQDKCLERDDSLVTVNEKLSSTQESLQSVATKDEQSTMHSIGTQTDHDVLTGSTVAMTTRNSDTNGRDTINIKSYDSISTETDLSAIGDRKTLESLLRWALAICTSEGDFSYQDAQELQYSKRNTDPLPIYPQACQWEKTTSDNQHSIGLERAQYGNSTKGNNDPTSDVLGEMFREDSHHDGDLLSRLHSSTLCSSDDMHAEKVEHRASNEFQSTVTLSDNLHVKSSHLNQTLDKQQESSIGNAIYDNLQVNSPHLDQTPGKQQESGIEMAISKHLQAPDSQQKLVSGMELLGEDMHLDQHLPTHVFDGTRIKEEYMINEEPVVQDVPDVGHNEEGSTDSNVFYQKSSTCTSSVIIAGKGNQNTSQSTSMATAVVSDHPCGMDRSTQANEGAYQCDVCGKRFKEKDNLNTHSRIHGDDKPFQCDVCHKKFTTKGNLKVHMRIHSHEKAYACTICTKRFTQSGALTIHMRVHSQERPYACTICKKRCTTSGNLTSHMRVHSQERPYTCPICKRRFTTSGSLTTHMRIHTAERPYLCQVCGKRFIRKSGLNNHSIVHSREYPHECSECGKGFRYPSHRDKHLCNHKCAKSPSTQWTLSEPAFI